MDPMTMVGIAKAGTSLLGSLFGSRNEKKQLQLQKEQLALQKQIAAEQQALAEKLMQLGLATQVDAQGNVVFYDEASNTWRTVPSAMTKQLMDASNTEELKRLTYDAPMARGEALTNARRRSMEGGIADSLAMQVQDRVAGRTGVTGSQLESALRRARTTAVNQGFDQVGNALATQALRSGAAGTEKLGGSLAKARAQAIAQTMGVPEIEGRQLASDINATELGNNINNYAAFASRAAGTPGFAFSPTSAGSQLSQALASSRNAAATGGSQSGSLLGSAGSIYSNLRLPDYKGQTNIWSDITGLIDAYGGDFADMFNNRTKKREPSTVDAF